MSKYLYHPYGDNALNANPYTRSGHGCGKLDMNGNHTPFYAMCNGQIVSVGTYSDGNFYCTQLCEDNALGMPFYIRYLHGDYVVNSGDYVTAGTLLGYTTTNNGRYNDHLHIDFIWGAGGWDSANDKGQSGPVAGTFNSDKTIYTVSGKQLKIKPNIINWNQLENWKNTDGSSNYGYCWVVFAQTPKQMKAYQSSGNSDRLKVTLDDYTAKMFVGLTATECSWSNAAVAQGVLTVCRNWIYMDCNNTLGKTDLSFTSADIQSKNALAKHFARFITGKVDWNLLDRYVNNYTAYFNKKVPGTNLTCLEFVKQFMSSGEHWTYIDKAIDNGSATLYSGRTKADVEDGVMFPSSSQPSQRLVLLPPFGDWILKWGTQGNEGSLTKPSQLLGLQ